MYTAKIVCFLLLSLILAGLMLYGMIMGFGPPSWEDDDDGMNIAIIGDSIVAGKILNKPMFEPENSWAYIFADQSSNSIFTVARQGAAVGDIAFYPQFTGPKLVDYTLTAYYPIDVMIVALGTNDILLNATGPTQNIMNSFQTLIDVVSPLISHLILVMPMPILIPPYEPASLGLRYRMHEFSNEWPKVSILDPFLLGVQPHATDVHWSVKDNEIMGNYLYDLLG